jgi:hypothetical protein
MNASARRIGWTLLTSLACTAPLASTIAAPFAGGSSATTQPSQAAPAAQATTPPTAPLPPEPSATAKPSLAESPRDPKPVAPAAPTAKQESKQQETGLFGGLSSLASKALPSSWSAVRVPADPAAATAKAEPKPTAKREPKPEPKPEHQPERETQGLFNVVASAFSFGGGSNSKPDTQAAPQVPPQPQPAKATARAVAPAPRAATGNSFDPSSFDPSVGLAGHFVSDVDQQLARATVSDDQLPGLPRTIAASPIASPIPTEDEPLESAVVTDEDVSLVSWLSSYASGATGGYGHTGRIGDRCCPKWEAQVDALFFWQGNLPSRPLYLDSATGATALDANQLQSKAAIAPRYAITYNHDQCRAIEVNYFQLYGFNAQQQLGPALDVAGNGPFTAADLVNPPYDQIAGALVTSSAHIQSLEVNLRRTDGGMIQWISGFRWLEWGQQLGIADVGASGGFVDGADIININTLNNLYGWQWGADMMLWNAGRWVRINGVAKAGVYYNHQAAQSTSYTDFFNPDVYVRDGEDTVSFVGETGLNASFALTNWLSWRAGYTFLWLGGVATPTGQLGLTDITTSTSAVNSNGSAYLHGVTTGLEARW